MGRHIRPELRFFLAAVITITSTACAQFGSAGGQVGQVATGTPTPTATATLLPATALPTAIPAPTRTRIPPTATPAPVAGEVKNNRFLLPGSYSHFRHHFSANGALVGLTSKDKLYVFTTQPFQLAYILNTPDGSEEFAFSPDGTIGAITLRSDPTVMLFDAKTGKIGLTLEGHGEINNILLFSHDNKILVGASSLYGINVWDVATGKLTNWISAQGRAGKKGLAYYGSAVSLGGVLLWTGSGELVPADHWMYNGRGTAFTNWGLCIREGGDVPPSLFIAHGPDFETEVQSINLSVYDDRPLISNQEESLLAIETKTNTTYVIDAFTGKIITVEELIGNAPGRLNFIVLDQAFNEQGRLVQLVLDQTDYDQQYVFLREVVFR